MTVHVVDAFEVVDVEHQDRDGAVRSARVVERVQQTLVEAAVVEEAGQRVGARLMLEPRADLCVVEREGGGIGEPPGKLELGFVEDAFFADAIDVEDALDPGARDQGDRDQGLRVDRRARHESHAGIEVGLVDERRLARARDPSGDPLVEADRRLHDLVGVLVARQHRREHGLRVVGLVDREGVVRDQIVERVGDAHEQRIEALLGEHLVEDVGEPPVGIDELGRRMGR